MTHTEPPSSQYDDQLAERLAEYDGALMDGTDPEPVPGDEDPALAEARSLLRLVARVIPRSTSDRPPPGCRQPTSERFGRFEIVHELGRGGFGVVFLARDPALGRLVALKLPLPEVQADEAARRRFLAEATAAAALGHPGIVTVFEAGEVGPIAYIVSAYVPGPTLGAWLRSGPGPVPAAVAARVAADLCDAVEHAHALRIIHRDLKPSNILIADATPPDLASGRAPTVRVTDFGLAKILDRPGEETASGRPLGSPPYMSPEQAAGRSRLVGPASDVYSLGTILYELLTGRPPFTGETPLETIRQVVADEPVAPRRLRPGLKRDLETIVLTCLAKEPGRRYPTARALGEDLGRHLRGEPILARPSRFWRPIVGFVRRRPATATLLASGFLIVIGLIAGELGYNAQFRIWNASLLAASKRERQQAEWANAARRQTEKGAWLVRRSLHAERLRTARRELEAGRAEVAQLVLRAEVTEAGERDPRGFAWHYLDRLARREMTALTDYPGDVTGLSIAPDGQTIAALSNDAVRGPTVLLWSWPPGRLRLRLRGHTGLLAAAAFSPDGTILATVGGVEEKSSELKLWDVKDGRLLADLPVRPRTVESVAFTPDGRTLAVAGRLHYYDELVELWDLSGGAPFPRRPVPGGGVRLHRDGRSLISFSRLPGGSLLLRDPLTGSPRRRYDLNIPDWLTATAITPDGATLGLGFSDGRIFLVDRARGHIKASRLAHAAVVVDVHFSVDGSRLASAGGDGFVRLWSGVDLAEVSSVRQADSDYARAVAFLPDGRNWITAGGGAYTRVRRLKILNDPPAPSGHTAELWTLAYTPDGRILASGGDDNLVRLWDVAAGREVARLRGHECLVTSLAISPNGRILVSGDYDGFIRLWRLDELDAPPTVLRHPARVRRVAIAPDGRAIASAGSDGDVRLWPVSAGEPARVLRGHGGTVVRALSFSPDGGTLATGGDDYRVVLWDLRAARPVSSRNTRDEVWNLAFSPDGRQLAATCKDGQILLWDAQGRLSLDARAHRGGVRGLAFSASGDSLATGGEDGTVRVWDPLTGQEMLTLTGHGPSANALAFSPDGSSLTSGYHDGRIRLWHATPLSR